MRQPNIAMEDSRKKEFEDYITERFPPGSKRLTSGVVYAAYGAAGYEAGRYALTKYLTGFKAGWGATNGCNPVSRLRSRSAGFEAGCPLRSGSGCESGRNIYTKAVIKIDLWPCIDKCIIIII